jgi:hypothetical protein
MSHPLILSLNTITCLATQSSVGSDNLVGIMGIDHFAIGRFNENDTINVGIDRPIAAGVTELTILNDPDDPLITVDLTKDMDVDRVLGILASRARYDVALKVTSEPD